jgi:hypothetical protein
MSVLTAGRWQTHRQASQYALAALICLISTRGSVLALAAVQLCFIVSPRLPQAWRKQADGSRPA